MRLIRLTILVILSLISWLSALISRHYSKERAYARLRFWCKLAIKVLGYRLEVTSSNQTYERQSIYYVSNHQGTFDPVILIAALDHPLSFVAKKQIKKLPVIGSWCKTIENIHFDRNLREDNIHMLRESARRLKQGDNILIFPEGTRSKRDQMNPFKVGSIQPAYLAKATIVPVVLNNAYAFDQSRPASKTMAVKILEPIPYDKYRHLNQEQITEKLQALIEAEIISNES